MNKYFVVAMTPFEDWDIEKKNSADAMAWVLKHDFPLQVEGTPFRMGAKRLTLGHRVFLFTPHAGDTVEAVDEKEAIKKAELAPFLKRGVPYIILVNDKVVEKSDDSIIMG